MNPEEIAADAASEALQDAPAPACVMTFNAADPSGGTGLAGDIATLAAMGAHALPVTTSILLRDSAEVFDHHAIDPEVVAEQARTVLQDITVAGLKVGFLGSADAVSAVAEILSDYPDLPLVSYLPNLNWLDDDQAQPYLEAFRELILPATEVLVGNHKTLTDFLLPEWDSERPPLGARAGGGRGRPWHALCAGHRHHAHRQGHRAIHRQRAGLAARGAQW